MKRPKEHVLEEESKLALRKLLPPEWIKTDIVPDYGLDMEVTIVEGEDVTNKILKLQIKATQHIKSHQEIIPLQIETKCLKLYENHPLPVLILYYIKSIDVFYYLFAQRYIKEKLTLDSPNWRKQKTATIKFPGNSKFDNIENIISIATDGYLYILQAKLQNKPEGATYWLDGIPKSDDKELKERTLKALLYASNNSYSAAIEEFENTLRICTVSPTQKLSILLNLGNAYYSLSQYQNALDNYKAILDLTEKMSERTSLEGKASALGNIGLILRAKGDLGNALKCLEDALKISRAIGYKQGEANQLGNIGIILRAKGDLDNALKYHEDALKVDREIGDKQGEASDLGNIGLIYSAKGDPDKALKYHEDALKIHWETGYKQGEAIQLGNIGVILRAKGDPDNALKFHEDALKIDRETGYKQGEAFQLGNVGLIYSAKGDPEKALKYLEDALNIFREIGHKQGEANLLGNIGLIFQAKGDQDNSLKYLEDALRIHREIGYKEGEASDLGNISLILRAKGDLDNALKYLEDALRIDREISHKQSEAN